MLCFPILRTLAAAAACLAGTPLLFAQSDDFNDKSDEGWTRYDPLAVFGAPGRFSFPAGGYELHSTSSPNPSALGPGRVASVRMDGNYTQFSVSADVVDWDTSLDQAFGLLGRIRQVGLGTSDGYIFLYRPFKGDFLIERLDNESGNLIATGSLKLDSTKDYRFTFAGVGSEFTGTVFDLADTSAPLLTVFASDSAYTTGVTGLLVTSNGAQDLGAGDATFDNYMASVPEPSVAGLIVSGVGLTLCKRRVRISRAGRISANLPISSFPS
ncbi:MAG: hypothetical protein JWL59_4286 [Chthoniobacteraceae bacterium]|nr:hypothetical protein [Chthoniobacteraceae bacterium]